MGERYMRASMRNLTRFAIAMAVASPVQAQTPAPTPMPIVAMGMTLPEYQGLGCLAGGVAGAAGVFVYSDVIIVAATGAFNPLLLVPSMATGLAVGCSVGAMMSPAFIWVSRGFGG